MRHFLKSWNAIDIFLKVGTNLTNLNHDE